MMNVVFARASLFTTVPVAGFVVCALAIVIAPSCGSSSAEQLKDKPAVPVDLPRDVTTAHATEIEWGRTLRATGELVAFAEATVGSKIAGRVESIAVDVGTRVKQGDVIAKLDARDFVLRRAAAVAALQAARARLGLPLEGDVDTIAPEQTSLVKLSQAQLDDAKRIRDRLAEVAETGAASKSEFDTAVANVAMAESRKQDALEETHNRRAQLAQRRADLALADQQLADASILAPFDGIVRDRRAAVGDFLAIGAPVAALVRFDPLRLRAEIPEREAIKAAVGQVLRFKITGDATVHEAKIARTSPSIDAQSRTLMIEADVQNPTAELRPGSFAEVELDIDAHARTLAIPPEALVSFAGIDKVFAVRKGHAIEVRVTVGRRDAQRIEIVSGIAANEEVVIAPGNLRSGAAVQAKVK